MGYFPKKSAISAIRPDRLEGQISSDDKKGWSSAVVSHISLHGTPGQAKTSEIWGTRVLLPVEEGASGSGFA